MTDTLQEQPSRATEVGRSRAEESLPVPGAAAPARKRIVIVGGGFAGIAAAHALRHADVEIVLIDRRNHHIFQPLLYQVATAILSPAEIAVRKPGTDLNAADLIAHCRRFLANYKIPRHMEFSETELPKGGSGKILKRLVRERFWIGQKRSVA
jgi:flavin-dependent dehydrogenase